MKIIEEGHEYGLSQFGDPSTVQHIIFYKMGVDGNVEHDGTTNEEVLAMLIDRLNYLQSKVPCRENALAITKLEESLMWLNKRTEGRKERGVEGTHIK